MRALILAIALLAAVIPAAQAAPWRITKDHWDEADERGFGAFVTALGESGCNSSQSCLRSEANPWRGIDAGFMDVDADCAKLPYLLRGYYAWKNGLLTRRAGAAIRGYETASESHQGPDAAGRNRFAALWIGACCAATGKRG